MHWQHLPPRRPPRRWRATSSRPAGWAAGVARPAGTQGTTPARHLTCARKAAKLRGYDLSALRARWPRARDFQAFDLLPAMDRGHLEHMQRHCPEVPAQLQLFLPFAGAQAHGEEVPIPTADRRPRPGARHV